MIQFLEDRKFMNERISVGIDVMPSDRDAREFQKLAKQIDPDRYFTLYGCQSCINTLVKFVFDNEEQLETEKIIKKATFPVQKPKFPKDRIN